jgi:hypothetical protein
MKPVVIVLIVQKIQRNQFVGTQQPVISSLMKKHKTVKGLLSVD